MNDTMAEAKTMMDTSMNTAALNIRTAQASFKDAAETGYSKISDTVEKSQDQLKAQMGKVMKKAEELASFNQGTMEAVTKSGQIWAAGVQDLSKQVAATAQSQLDQTMSAFKALAGLRSLKDMMDLQASFTRAAVESAMTETSRLTDAGFRLAEQTMAPLTARVSLAVETFSKAGASAG